MKQVMFCIIRNTRNSLNRGNNCGVVNFDEKSGYFEGFICHYMSDGKFYNTYLVFGAKNGDAIEMYELGNGVHTCVTYHSIFKPTGYTFYNDYEGSSSGFLYDNCPKVCESELYTNRWFDNFNGKRDWNYEEVSKGVSELVKFMSSETHPGHVAMERFIGKYWDFREQFCSNPPRTRNLAIESGTKNSI